MGLACAGVPHRAGGVRAAMDYLAAAPSTRAANDEPVQAAPAALPM
jgi:hypothetical protein